MDDKDFMKEIQKRMDEDFKVIDFKHHSKMLTISIDEVKACIEFEKIRKTIKSQLSHLKFILQSELTGKNEEYELGNIVKATISDNNSLDLSYTLKRINR